MPDTDARIQDGLLTVRQLDEGPQLRLALHGELDLSNAKTVEAALTGALTSEKKIIFDLTGLEFLDSTGIALLVGTLGRRDAERFSFVPSKAMAVRRLLNQTGLDRRMVLFTTTESLPALPAV